MRNCYKEFPKSVTEIDGRPGLIYPKLGSPRIRRQCNIWLETIVLEQFQDLGHLRVYEMTFVAKNHNI